MIPVASELIVAECRFSDPIDRVNWEVINHPGFLGRIEAMFLLAATTTSIDAKRNTDVLRSYMVSEEKRLDLLKAMHTPIQRWLEKICLPPTVYEEAMFWQFWEERNQA